MTRAKYLKTIGYIELVLSFIGIGVGFIYMIGVSMGSAWALNALGLPGAVTGLALFIMWIVFLIACFFAPAVGFLFISVGDLLDYQPITLSDVTANVEPKLNEINSRLRKIEESIKSAKPSSIKEESNVAIHKESNEKPVKEKSNESDRKKGFALDDKVTFKEDMVIDGVSIKQGQTGVIVDILVSFAGRQYAVILDDNEERVLAREDCFE